MSVEGTIIKRSDDGKVVVLPPQNGAAPPAATSHVRNRRPKTSPRPIADAAAKAAKTAIEDDHDEHRVIDEADAALGKCDRLFVAGSQLVELDDRDEQRPIVRARARDLVTSVAYFYQTQKSDSGGEIEVERPPPKYLGDAILARPTHPSLRKLEGVTRTPILQPSGVVVDAPGYDASSRLFYAPTCTFPPMPAPTEQAARAAFDRLAVLFDDFPFADAQLGRSLAVAAILGFVARNLYDHAPTIVCSGSSPGCGKGLAVDVETTIGLGAVLSRSPWPVSPDEQRKLLDGFARSGARGILLDNITAPLGGADIERNVTSTMVGVRLLGRTETASYPWRAVILVTGNNVRFAGDMPRRALLSRIVPPDDRPDQRADWRYPRLLEHVTAERPRLAIEALTILAAHARAGRPAASRAGGWGSFDQWTSVVADAVVFAGGRDPLDARVVRDERTDSVREALDGLVRVWLAFGGPVGVELACAQIVDRCSADAEARLFLDELLDDQVPAASDKQTKAARLVVFLGRHAERWTEVDGRLLGFVRGGASKFGRRWKLAEPGRAG